MRTINTISAVRTIMLSILLASVGCSDNGFESDPVDAESPANAEQGVMQPEILPEPEISQAAGSPPVEMGVHSPDNELSSGCDTYSSSNIAETVSADESSNPSHTVSTSDMAVRFNLELDQYTASSASLKISVRVHSLSAYLSNEIGEQFAGSFPLEMTAGDQLVIFYAGTRQVLEDKPIYFGLPGGGSELREGYGNYSTTLNDIKPGQCIRVAIERKNGEADAISTIITVPPMLSLLSPAEGENYSPDDYVSVTWGLLADDGNTRLGFDLARFSTVLKCENEEGVFIAEERLSDPLLVDTSPRAPQILQVSDILPPPREEGFQLSGCKLDIIASLEFEPEFTVDYDPALANSTQILPAYFEKFEYGRELRRTINLF